MRRAPARRRHCAGTPQCSDGPLTFLPRGVIRSALAGPARVPSEGRCDSLASATFRRALVYCEVIDVPLTFAEIPPVCLGSKPDRSVASSWHATERFGKGRSWGQGVARANPWSHHAGLADFVALRSEMQQEIWQRLLGLRAMTASGTGSRRYTHGR